MAKTSKAAAVRGFGRPRTIEGVPIPKPELGEVLIKVFASVCHTNLGHDLPSYFTGQGFAPQISAAYWAMVRSLENFPEPATLRTALRVHARESV